MFKEQGLAGSELSKISKGYLEQLSKNSSEKVGMLLESIQSDELPLCNGKLRVVEIGPGGGESLKRLQSSVYSKKMELYAIDLFEHIAKKK